MGHISPPAATFKLLLIPAPYVDAGRVLAYVPYGLLSLQAAAQASRSQVDILQLDPLKGRVFSCSDELVTAIADLVPGDKYGVVGLSTMCSSFHHSVGIACELKRRYPRLRIWMGGPQVSIRPRAALESYPELEAVFVGEAEETFREVLTRRKAGEGDSLAGIPGVCTRGVAFVRRPPIENLDSLPSINEAPSFLASLEGAEYARREIPVEAERGCNGRCAFCSTSLYWSRRVRRKSAKRLLEETDRLMTLTGIRSVSLVGDNLATSRRWLLELCGRFAREAPEGLKWGGSLTLGRLREEDLTALWNAGCRSIFVGLESASQLTLDRIHKNIDLGRSLAMLDHALAMGFRVQVSLIVGFPWETASDLRDTYDLHVSLLKRGVGSQVETLCPLPGTLLEQTERVDAGDGISAAAFDGLPHGPVCEANIRRCPPLFTQLGSFATPRVDSSQVKATVRAGMMAGNHYGRMRTIEVDSGSVAGNA